MKSTIYSLVIILLTTAVSIYSCKEDSPGNNLVIDGRLIGKSECKSNLKVAVAPTPDTLSCIEYYFDASNNKLILNHINAGFNCCPDSVYCSISQVNDTILVREYETASLCNCDCLYDLNIEVTGVDLKSYQMKFIEPYLDVMDEINFKIDLTDKLSGSYCVVRKQYPWGVNSN